MPKTKASAAWFTQFALLMWKNWTLSVRLPLPPPLLRSFAQQKHLTLIYCKIICVLFIL
jgi:hypothetical protein